MRGVMVLTLSWSADAIDNGVGLTPAMGYNTWDVSYRHL